MKKRKVAMLMAVVMAVSTLAACGSTPSAQGETTDQESTAAEETAAEETADTGEVKKVRVWNQDSGEKVFMDELVEEFNTTIGKENGVEIELEHVESSSADQELAVALQNGVAPDIFSGGSREYVEKGYIADLESFEDLKELVEKNDLRLEGANSYSGKIYSIPVALTVAGLAYNKDLFKEAGIVDENGEAKAPETYDEMLEDARKLTDTSKQQFGFGFPMGWGVALPLYYVFRPSQSSSGLLGGSYNYQTGEFDFSGIKPLTETYLQMKDEGLMFPGMESLDNDAARARFAEGNIGMMMTVQWDCAVWNDQFPAKCDWGVVPFPVADTNNVYRQWGESRFSYNINAQCIKDGREKEVALVYNYLYSDETLIKKAEAGMMIPWREDLVEKCDFSNSPKGWNDYCQLSEITEAGYKSKFVNLDEQASAEDEFNNKVWTGEWSIDKFIENMNERYNEGTQRFEEGVSDDLKAVEAAKQDPTFDIKR